MEPLNLSAHDRVIKVRNHALATDADGREVLIGLDRRQSEWLIASGERQAEGLSEADSERFLTLYAEHETARAAVLGPAPTRAIDY